MDEAKLMIKGLRQIGLETEQQRGAKEREARLSRRKVAATLKAANAMAVRDVKPERYPAPGSTPSTASFLDEFEA